jgi:hypothetical protein
MAHPEGGFVSKLNAIPFHRAGNSVLNSQGKEVCTCVGLLEAKDVTDALNLWGGEPTKDTPPTPNQAETDAVAVEYYKSGRTLEVQYWEPASREWVTPKIPYFDPAYAWRIRPAKTRVVVEVYQSPIAKLFTVIRGSGEPISAIHKLVGTIEGEVEV